MPGQFAMPPDYFQCPPLSQREIDEFVEMGSQSTHALIMKAKLQGGTYDWKLLKDDSELKIYKGHSHGSTNDAVLHCGVMEVIGELDECMELHHADTTEAARAYALRFGHAYVDVLNLHTVLPRHPDRPNDCIQIKWFLSKSPLDGLIIKRDFLMLESDLEFQVGGKRAWVRSYRSIDLAAVPDMRKELGCIRGSMYDMGFVAVESDRPGYLVVTYLADMDIKGIVPSWANDQTMKFWLRSMFQIDRFLRENRLSRTPFLKREQLCPLHKLTPTLFSHIKFGDDFVRAVYGDFSDGPASLTTKTILTPLNENVLRVNNMVLDAFPGDEMVFRSADVIPPKEVENASLYPTEFLNTIDEASIPLHALRLKIGCTVKLLRNLKTTRRLCKGTRLRVDGFLPTMLQVTIISQGAFFGEKHLLPRIALYPSETRLPFCFKRLLFPLRLAFAMTINKAQGQTLDTVGFYMPNQLFAHGQLYVTLSRTRTGLAGIIFCNARQVGCASVTNVVYSEIFQ
ncbi:hypothetical protein Ae201684_017775 [Aphanomyces euteiches]|uniref:START domain-containing protein n=1 Tax=Aphanomyces euteiches TaxID=100861 RepID=A0A6G0WAQ6_9STRA|nr:hypothetical protein Ae201684_017775 [Aphanomyces euteiches]